MAFTGSQLEILMEKQGGKCFYSGVPLTFDNVSADHSIPLSRGGSNDIENIRLVTKRVQKMKGRMTHDEFIRVCTDIVAQQCGGQASGQEATHDMA